LIKESVSIKESVVLAIKESVVVVEAMVEMAVD
jgi:hypothetical protein